jgi:hypothetical protein
MNGKKDIMFDIYENMGHLSHEAMSREGKTRPLIIMNKTNAIYFKRSGGAIWLDMPIKKRTTGASFNNYLTIALQHGNQIKVYRSMLSQLGIVIKMNEELKQISGVI